MIGREFPIGAECQTNGVDFRVWAPDCRKVVTILNGHAVHPLKAEGDGYFSGFVAGVKAGALYQFQLDDSAIVPDPVSRFQPEGPHGPSQVIDPEVFDWTDKEWTGQTLVGAVIYEMHIGTFTAEGTWDAAIRELQELATLGVNCIEVMPVGDFCGTFGWGYDGVNLFAPTRLYGSPDDFRKFVNVAHSHRISVVLDVVYNHLGPDGNYLGQFAADYFTDR